jgi:hypothetical protein
MCPRVIHASRESTFTPPNPNPVLSRFLGAHMGTVGKSMRRGGLVTVTRTQTALFGANGAGEINPLPPGIYGHIPLPPSLAPLLRCAPAPPAWV